MEIKRVRDGYFEVRGKGKRWVGFATLDEAWAIVKYELLHVSNSQNRLDRAWDFLHNSAEGESLKA